MKQFLLKLLVLFSVVLVAVQDNHEELKRMHAELDEYLKKRDNTELLPLRHSQTHDRSAQASAQTFTLHVQPRSSS